MMWGEFLMVMSGLSGWCWMVRLALFGKIDFHYAGEVTHPNPVP